LIYLIKSLPQKENYNERTILFIHTKFTRPNSSRKAVDGQAKFREDLWDLKVEGEEPVIENGAVFEKGGVNILLFMEIAADSMQKLFNVG
jgi:coproporphyrinogen III oxidase